MIDTTEKPKSTVNAMLIPFLEVMLGKILMYLADHTDEILDAIRAMFSTSKTDAAVGNAIKELGYDPTAENLEKLRKMLDSKGEDTDKLASLLVSKTIC